MTKLKTVDIKGKPYVMVHDRILEFHRLYKNGSISSSHVKEGETWIVRTTIQPDMENAGRVFTGLAQEVEGDGFINKTSALENAETSAVGRALGMLGIGIIDGIASADEIHKSENRRATMPPVDLKNSVFVKTKWISDKADRDEVNAGIKSIGGKWIPEKKVWAIPADQQNNIPTGSLKGVEEIFSADGEKLSFAGDVLDEKPF